MNKLWKRIVMLGALVGCMATAAWAGNVEVKINDDTVGSAEIQYSAEGYYRTSYTDSNAVEPSTTEYHFNKYGEVAWERSGGTVTQYTYDENGNVIRTASSIDHHVQMDKGVETYRYDGQGRIVSYERKETWFGRMIHQTSEYTYEDRHVTVEWTDEEGDDYKSRARLEYTLNEKNQVVSKVIYLAMFDEDYGAPEEIKFLYDGNGNLVQATSTNGDTWKYTYDEDGKCIRSESSGYPRVYEYDANGNVTSVSEVHNSNGQEIKELLTSYTYEKLSPVQDDSAFTDVTDKNGFAYDAVIWATEMGITKGTTETTFSPRAQCTRAQMVTFLWRAAGSPEPKTTENPFTDVKEGAYYKAILWAVENGITKGTSADKFSPNAKCTRGQIVTFIYRAAGEPEVETDENPFQDVKGGAYYDAILWAVENGITNGTTATTFSPNTICNRGQGVTFLYRGIGLY